MSDPMAKFAQKYGGGMGAGGANPTEQVIKENRSFLNPTDAGVLGAEGAITQDMSIRQFLESQGMDVEGPVTQLVEWQMSQMEKADPMNKMKAIAGQGGANMPPQGQPPGAGSRLPQGRKPAAGAGLSGLKGAMTGGA